MDGVYHPLWAAFSNNPTPRSAQEATVTARTGLSPSLGYVHKTVFITGLRAVQQPRRTNLNTTLPSDQTDTGFGAGLIPLHSQLLGESWLVSFPPLSDMLKFSGYSRLIRGQERKVPYGMTTIRHNLTARNRSVTHVISTGRVRYKPMHIPITEPRPCYIHAYGNEPSCLRQGSLERSHRSDVPTSMETCACRFQSKP